jgi:hypothetical protein
MTTVNFGDGVNDIKMIICNHLEHLQVSRRSAVPETAQSQWACFSGVNSSLRAQGGQHNRRDTAISRSE